MDESEISRIYMALAPVVGMFAAAIVGQIAGERAKRWSAEHDRRYRTPGTAEQLVFGPMLSSFGTMRRYSQLRRARGESRATSILFWVANLASILFGCVALGIWFFG